jgi:hypothetical protein
MLHPEKLLVVKVSQYLNTMLKIPLYRGRKHNLIVVGYALVSEIDFEYLNRFRWGLNTGYAVRSWGRRPVLMHREIMCVVHEPLVEVNHLNFNRLDNRRKNLMVVTPRDNLRHTRSRGGTSQYRGVSWDKSKGKWYAKITVNYKQIPLGRFDDEHEAHRVVEAARSEVD